MGTARRPHGEFHSSPPPGTADLVWNRPGNLSRGETKKLLGHWQVPGWADAPDGGRYWILPEGEYDTSSPEGTTWTAWVLYDDGRYPTQLARNANGQRAYDAVIEHKNYTLYQQSL
jgi:hypothetical protein